MTLTSHDTRVGVYAVVQEDEQVLLALWNEGIEPQWTLPGGGLELHEDPEAGLARELREETGYDVAVDALLHVVVDVIPAEARRSGRPVPLRRVRLLYAAHRTGGRLAHELDGTTDEARWVAVPDMAMLPHTDLVDTALALGVLHD